MRDMTSVPFKAFSDDLRRQSPLREAEGFRYSYDMLGEAAVTAGQAARYFADYQNAIRAIGAASNGRGVQDGPGISVKLSALHPRFEAISHQRVMKELVPRLIDLAKRDPQLACEPGAGGGGGEPQRRPPIQGRAYHLLQVPHRAIECRLGDAEVRRGQAKRTRRVHGQVVPHLRARQIAHDDGRLVRVVQGEQPGRRLFDLAKHPVDPPM